MASTMREELELLGSITVHLIIALLIISYISVGLRLWARYRVTKSPGWDDAAIIATLMLFTCYCSFVLAATFRTRNAKALNQQRILTTLVFVQLSEVFYILTTTFLKISLGLFFLRVLTKKWQRLLFKVILTIGGVYGLFYLFIVLFQCGDPAHIADNVFAGSKNRCLPEMIRLTCGYIYGVINVLSDWTFVLIPITVLMDSDLDRRSKMSVSMVMALGALGSVSAIMRLVYLDGLGMSTMSALNAQAVKATIWATAEPGTGIIAASIAILRPLFRQLATDVRRQATSMSKSRNGTQSDDSIALTGNEAVTQTVKSKRMSVDSIHSEDGQSPWSPTIVATADVQRMIIVNGKTSRVP